MNKKKNGIREEIGKISPITLKRVMTNFVKKLENVSMLMANMSVKFCLKHESSDNLNTCLVTFFCSKFLLFLEQKIGLK